MSQQEDISWQVLRRIVHDWAGESAELEEVKPLDGGSISTTLLLTTNDLSRAVLKISPYRVDRSYEAEAHHLDLLRSLNIPTPKIYQCKTGTLDDPNSYLLLEFMPGVDLHHAKLECSPEEFDRLQHQLAEIMIAIHQQTATNYCRLMHEGCPHFETWPAFYHEIYDPVWNETQKLNVLPIKMRKQIGKLHERLDQFLAHKDVPRLVHWDIWASNLLCTADSEGNWQITSVLDPMCKYAHSEAEIAYMDLFHTITPAFSKAYQQQFKLDDSYHRIRKPIYQLYPLMNHVCLFGAEYMKPLMATMDRLQSFI